jgi:creatinine amidohydrolase/Fe(II)-dependent formamide hydrolase-like protein
MDCSPDEVAWVSRLWHGRRSWTIRRRDPRHRALSATTLIRLRTELGEGLAPAGVRKLVLFNSHRGQPQVMDIVARDLRVRPGMMVVAYSWYAAGVPAGQFPDHEVQYGIHAGAIAARPRLAVMVRAGRCCANPQEQRRHRSGARAPFAADQIRRR